MSGGSVSISERARARVLGYRSHQVLACVREHIANEGVAPSYGMICEELGINGRHKVCVIIKRLEKRGLLKRTGAGHVRSGALWNKPIIQVVM